MTLKTQYEADRDLWLSTDLPWVQTGTYNGTSIPISIQVNTEDMGDGRKAAAEAVVSADAVAAPAYRDVVVVDGVTWYVMRVLSGDGASHKLELYRGEQPVWR